MAIAYEKTGDIARSKDTYNTLAKINMNNAEVLLRQGSLYLRENDNNSAKECFIKLVNSEEHLVEAHLGLSKVYLFMNDPESCIQSCDKLLEYLRLPRNITINSLSDISNLYVLIGTTLRKKHQMALSDFSFEIAVLLNPDALKAIQPEAKD